MKNNAVFKPNAQMITQLQPEIQCEKQAIIAYKEYKFIILDEDFFN